MKARKWLPLLIMLGLAAGYGGPLLITYVANAEQDECTFGPVSNFQYRTYLSRAKDLSSKTPGSFSWNQEEAQIRFNELFEDLIDRKPSVYERIAAAHALLRSFGAQYRNMSGTDPDPFGSVAKTGGVVGFNYLLDINRLGLFHPFLPFMRQAWITVNLGGPALGPVPPIPGDIRFTVNYPAFDTPPRSDRAEQCPPVPNQALSESFSRTTK